MSHHDEGKHVTGDYTSAEITERMLRRKIDRLERENAELVEALEELEDHDARLKEELSDVCEDRAEQVKEKYNLKTENARLKHEASKWFQKGRESVLRENRSGCCCKLDEDGNELLEPCLLHEQWLVNSVSRSISRIKQDKSELIEVLKHAKQMVHFLRSLSDEKYEADHVYEEIINVLSKYGGE